MHTLNSKRNPVLSVIIGIRDWEISRLQVAIRSHANCTISDVVEIVVSDYGSQNCEEVERLARDMGCTYVHTDSELWSRSRALNTGIVASRGEFVLATDADIIFAPETHAITVDLLWKFPGSLQLKQCRDLSEYIGLDDLDNLERADWQSLSETAHTRPRWGMGGLAACSRKTADRVRGYDERMVIWGAEDNDFGKRVRATGGILNWITDPAAQIFHVWHPPFMQTNPDASEIFEINRGYLNNDSSVIRNLAPGTIYRGLEPMVTVVIATKNRAHYLRSSIESVLNQSFGELELIVIDDGSEDDTQDVLASISDPRLKHVRNDISQGVGAARNTANALARGRYIAVHDDDDIMMPQRIETQLGSIMEGIQGVYGGWIDFNDETGELSYLPGKEPFNLAAICFSGSVVAHGTLLIETQFFAQFPYHTEFKAGSDYNVVFRMAWNGLSLGHCGEYVTLRRIHPLNMTTVSKTVQKISSRITNSMLLNSVPSSLERSLRNWAEETTEVAINISNDIADAVLLMLPEYLTTKAAYSIPTDLGGYEDTNGVVLVGQMSDLGMELREELSALSDPGPRHTGKVSVTATRVGTGAIEMFSRRDSTLTEPLDCNIFTGMLNLRETDWIILAAADGDTLVTTLEQTRLEIPFGEDILMCRQNGRWLIAFEAGSPQRALIIDMKADIIGKGIDIRSIRKMTS
jgi:glycosyltransferase involved in cell wall biosynthesis